MASESVFVLLGSNLGDRELLVNQACKMMGERCGEIVAKSRLYESEPWGFQAEHWFLNQVVELKTSLSPLTLAVAARTSGPATQGDTIDVSVFGVPLME